MANGTAGPDIAAAAGGVSDFDQRDLDWYIDKAVQVLVFIGGVSGRALMSRKRAGAVRTGDPARPCPSPRDGAADPRCARDSWPSAARQQPIQALCLRQVPVELHRD